MSKSYSEQSHKRDWYQQDKESCSHSLLGFKHEQRPHKNSYYQTKTEFPLKGSTSSGIKASSFQSISTNVNHNRHFPDLLATSYEIKWLFHTLTTLSLALESAISQFGALVLLAVTLLLLSAQVIGLIVILSSATTLPLGFQFLVAAVGIISATVFKIMY